MAHTNEITPAIRSSHPSLPSFTAQSGDLASPASFRTGHRPNGIESRYEFRCWPSSCQIDGIAHCFADWHQEGEEQRTDTYILRSGHPDTLAKLRDGTLLEVKRRLSRKGRIDLWALELSSPLPLDDGARRWLARDCEFSPFNTSAWSRSAHALLCQISIEPHWDFLPVSKIRTNYSKGALSGEVTLISARGTSMHTVALESEDEKALERVLGEQPFAGLANRDYGVVLKDMIER